MEDVDGMMKKMGISSRTPALPTAKPFPSTSGIKFQGECISTISMEDKRFRKNIVAIRQVIPKPINFDFYCLGFYCDDCFAYEQN